MLKSIFKTGLFLTIFFAWILLVGSNPIAGILTLVGGVVLWLVYQVGAHLAQGRRVESWKETVKVKKAETARLEAERKLAAIRAGGATTP